MCEAAYLVLCRTWDSTRYRESWRILGACLLCCYDIMQGIWDVTSLRDWSRTDSTWSVSDFSPSWCLHPSSTLCTSEARRTRYVCSCPVICMCVVFCVYPYLCACMCVSCVCAFILVSYGCCLPPCYVRSLIKGTACSASRSSATCWRPRETASLRTWLRRWLRSPRESWSLQR